MNLKENPRYRGLILTHWGTHFYRAIAKIALFWSAL